MNVDDFAKLAAAARLLAEQAEAAEGQKLFIEIADRYAALAALEGHEGLLRTLAEQGSSNVLEEAA